MKNPKMFPGIKQAVIVLIVFLCVILSWNIAVSVLMETLSLAVHPAFRDFMPVVSIFLDIVCYVVLLWFGLSMTKRKFSDLFAFKPIPKKIIFPLISLLFGFFIVYSEIDNIINYFFPIPEFFAKLLLELIQPTLMSVIQVIILAPVFEEMLFRGLILRGFLQRYSPAKAIFVSSLLFAVIHINPHQMLPGLLMGILFAWLTVKTKSLVPSIFSHMFVNCFSWMSINGIFPPIPGFSTGRETLLLKRTVEFQPIWLDFWGVILLAASLIILIRSFRKEALIKATGSSC